MATLAPRRAEPLPQIPMKPPAEGEETDRVARLIAVAQTYGPAFQVNLPQRPWVVTANYKLSNELFDEKRFIKKELPFPGARLAIPTSIFTVSSTDPMWAKAHSILLPLFSPQAIKGYIPRMWDATMSMIYKWEQLNPDEEIDVCQDMGRITTDIIGSCALDYHFRSFYRDTPHPLIQSLMRALEAAIFKPVGPEEIKADADYLRQMVAVLVQQHRASKNRPADTMLNQLLEGVDLQTGQKFTDAELEDQIITVLFAGHITTSALLANTFYQLVRNPTILAKVYDEVDRVLDTVMSEPPTSAQLSKLTYLSQVFKETLRLHPSARILAVQSIKDTEMLADTYEVTSQQDLVILTQALHRDPSVWGKDAGLFNPDRFAPEAEAKIPVDAYKPFGNGVRSCIGRAFALTEAPLVFGMLLRHFDLIDHSGYHLTDKTQYLQKPEGFKIQVRRRSHAQPVKFAVPGVQVPEKPVEAEVPAQRKVKVKAHNTPMFVLFGSNLGTSEGLARKIGDDARDLGFTVAVDSLDDVVDRISARPEKCALVIVASSYNGFPSTNATRFYELLENSKLGKDALKGVRYAVFGCGNKQWASTYQAVPTFIDERLEKLGAKRMVPLGTGDASADLDDAFRTWYKSLWPATAKAFSLELAEAQPEPAGPLYRLEVTQGELTPSPYVASYSAVPLTILSNEELQHPTSPQSTRCIEVELPRDARYKAGDHLGILAHNPIEEVERVAKHFGCDERTVVRIHKNDMRRTSLPINTHIRVYSLLSTFVELHETVTRRQIARLAEYTELPAEKEHLLALVGEDEASKKRYQQQIQDKCVKLVDLLASHPSCDVPAAVLLEFLPPLRPRYYSISSSALVDPHRCRITVGVIKAPALAREGVIHQGTSSSFLSRRAPGETIYGFVQDTRSPFHHPDDSALPIIMVCAGTGLAPFMGFLQERAALQAEGKKVGPSLLFFGCRHPEQDFLYEEELEEYTERGLTQLHVAYSRNKPQPKTYVQDKVLEQQDLVWNFIEQGAPTFICGDMQKMVPGVAQSYRTIYQNQRGVSAKEAEKWLDEMTARNRYVVDIWGSPGSF